MIKKQLTIDDWRHWKDDAVAIIDNRVQGFIFNDV